MALMTRAGTHQMRALAALRALTVATLLAALLLAGGGAVSAQDAERRALELDLARVLIDDQMRQGLSDQVGLGLLQLLGTRLQERLNRRLQEAEVQTLAEIIRAFVGRTLTEERIEEIGARVYALALAESAGVTLEQATTTKRLMERTAEAGYRDNYYTAVIRTIAKS
jgi:aldehyde:ferredoxin oxidoreductase